MTDDDGWTHYAPMDGPPDDTRCSFCRTEYKVEPRAGWMISPDAAICPQCIDVAARGLARFRSSDDERP
jgi:hypothetical protein